MMLAIAVLLGCGLIAWSVYYIGRQIARVLWGILCVIETNADQKAIFEQQRAELFGDHRAPIGSGGRGRR